MARYLPLLILVLGLAGCGMQRHDYNRALEQYVSSDFAGAAREFARLSEDGFAPAQYRLGIMYLKGLGVDKNARKGIAWLKAADRQDHLPASFYLASFYLTGTHLPRDMKRAFEIFSRMAERDFAPAQFQLAVSYGQGRGVDRDPSMAIHWLERAANNGFAPAATELAAIHEKGLFGVPADKEAAQRWRDKTRTSAF